MISIIIPCTEDKYKTEFLPQCLETLKHQTKNNQIIVAYFDKNKDRITDVINNAINKCKYDYFMVLGADDLLCDSLDILVKNLDGSDVIYGNIKLIGDRNEDVFYSQVNSIDDFRNYNPIPYTSVVKKAAWKKINGYANYENYSYPEDYDFWTRLYKSGAKFKYINEFIYQYRIHKDQASHIMSPRYAEFIKYLNEKIIDTNDKKLFYKIKTNALGDCIAATPTLRKISKAYDQKVNVITHIPDLFKNNPYVEKIYDINDFNDQIISKNDELFESFDPLKTKKHNNYDIRRFHSTDIGFDLLDTEMEYDFAPDEDNNFIINRKYICLHAVTSWQSRTYSKENWQTIINELEKIGYFIVIIGKDTVEHGFWNIDKKPYCLSFFNGLNLTNKLNLSQLWHILNNADFVITMDSGILHFAGTTNTFIIQLGSSINNKYRAPYRKSTQEYKYKYISGTCDIFCGSNMKYGIKEWNSLHGIPPLVKCLENKTSFECHSNPSDVIDFIKNQSQINSYVNTPKKYLFIAGHLSTGGGPKYLEWLITKIKNEGHIVKVIEWNIYSQIYVIQRNSIINLIGAENFLNIGAYDESDETFTAKEIKAKNLIDDFKPDFIHLNDPPEIFAIKPMSKNFLAYLYKNDKTYKVIETCHTSEFDFNKKIYIPDLFWFCSKYHLSLSKNLNVPKTIVDMNIPPKTRPDRNKTLEELGLDPSYYHVLQVGLFNKNKNQKFTFDLAKKFIDRKILFHFIGNLCYINECEINKDQKNCIVWGERSDVDKFMSCMDLFLMPSLKELNPISIKEAISWGMKAFISELDVYKDIYSDNKKIEFIRNNNLLNYINNLNLPFIDLSNKENEFTVSFDKETKIEITGDYLFKYEVKFIDKRTNVVFYQTFLSKNMWASSFSCESNFVKIIVENLINKKIYTFEKTNDENICVINESNSLGDTLAWIPMVNKFAETKNIKVDLYTPYKYLFDNQYEKINFFNYDEKTSSKVYSKIYNLTFDCSRKDNTKNLQKNAADILGIDFFEEKPRLFVRKPLINHFKKKYVCIAIQSTSQFKYWNNPTGWQQLVDYLKELDYEVVCIDKNNLYGISGKMNQIPKNCIDKTGDFSLQDRINDLNFCEFFIGLTSGLSWLAWAINKPVVLISGISKEHNDFYTPYRITNTNVCHGCASEENYKFDKSNWMFCPKNKNFECTVEITFEMVKEKIDELINNLKNK